LAGFAAAGFWRPGVSFEPAAPTQLSSCLGESWEAVNARKELQTERISGVFDQKLMILILARLVTISKTCYNNSKIDEFLEAIWPDGEFI